MFSIPLPWPESSLLLHPQWSGLPALLRVVLLCGVVAVPLVLLVWLYRFELRLVPRMTALGLLGLRLAVLVLVLFVVCLQPIFARDRLTELPGRILIAVDRSGSMDVPDPQRDGADKLRLARALGLTGDVPDAMLNSWLAEHEQKRDPVFVTPDEKQDDPAARAQLQEQRRKAHDAIIEKIDSLTRSDIARLVLGDGVKLLGSISEKHTVDLLGFHRDLWELKPDQLDELFRKPEAQQRPAARRQGTGAGRAQGAHLSHRSGRSKSATRCRHRVGSRAEPHRLQGCRGSH